MYQPRPFHRPTDRTAPARRRGRNGGDLCGYDPRDTQGAATCHRRLYPGGIAGGDGIIALLVSILLPSLNRARESAKQIKCLSNMKQVGLAMVMYTNENRGFLPYDAPATGHNDADFLWWQPAYINDIGIGGIGPYLKISANSTEVLHCPSDEVIAHVREGANAYPFSYVMNWFTCANSNAPAAGRRGKLSMINDSSDKVLLYEEDERTIDDGNGALWYQKGGWASVNLLAIRHDHNRRLPDTYSVTEPVPNPGSRGNVAFCDGHAEYVPRNFCHAKTHAVPNPGDFPTDPELGP